MYLKQMFIIFIFSLLIKNPSFTTTINLNGSKNQNETKNIEFDDSSSTKEKILDLFSNLKKGFSSNQNSNDRKEEIIKNLEKITKKLSIAHVILKIPNALRSSVSKTDKRAKDPVVGDYYSNNLFALRTSKKIIKSITESEEPISTELTKIIEKIIRKHIKYPYNEDFDENNEHLKKWDKAISELIKLISLRINNKLIKNNIENRKIRRLVRAIMTSLINTISREFYKTGGCLFSEFDYERATYKILKSIILYSWIEFMGETILQNIEKITDKN